MNIGASFGSVARTILSTVCKGNGDEVHICLDKYLQNSIKDSERILRGAVDLNYNITGADQKMRQRGDKLLSNSTFKNELGKFLLREWQKDHYWHILNGKTLFASYGGDCIQYTPTDDQQIIVTKSTHLQADHEEADTLIGFHLTKLKSSTVLVRASDTDVLVILIGLIGNQRPEVRSMTTVIMDYETGNNRRYINVTDIVNALEERTPGLSRAMLGYNAFTGCDFTSAFYRKGKVKPLEIVEKDATGRFLNLFINMCEKDGRVDIEVASEFVCKMYGQTKETDVDEARHSKLMQMTGKVDKNNPLFINKRIDCALLPPSRPALEKQLQRAHFVTVVWSHTDQASPDQGLSPTDYGWSTNGELLQPMWFDGPAVPDTLFTPPDCTALESDSDETIIQVDSDEDMLDEADGISELSDSDLSDNEI
ncbi:uncharacterized protein [Palaemon carinicauda]|uniref:uncharacterized protein n=1 Tax=Palaemon carinicauda TaxID=392227 RepID=UPI0035B62E07